MFDLAGRPVCRGVACVQTVMAACSSSDSLPMSGRFQSDNDKLDPSLLAGQSLTLERQSWA